MHIRSDQLPMIHLAKWVLSSSLTVAVAAYGLGCFDMAMATPKQAMQCCNTMRCHSHSSHRHHGQGCCTTTSRIRSALRQTSSVQGIPFSPVAHIVSPSVMGTQFRDVTAGRIACHSHDPPSSSSVLVLSLRI